MNEEFQEEWLSAYLDDELTDEQRLVVEQRLSIDPAAQTTLEDLQRIRSMVAKLPRLSGPDLKFPIPTELPSNSDEIQDDEVDGETANDEIADDSNRELEDFEDMPRLLAEVERPRVSLKSNSNGTTRSVLGGIATAASLLLVAGLGYLYWPTTGQQLPNLALNNASPAAKNMEPSSRESERVSVLDFSVESSSNAEEALGKTVQLDLPGGGEGQFGRDSSDKNKAAPLEKKSLLSTESDPSGVRADEPIAANRDESKMKVESFSSAAPSQPVVPGELLDGLSGGYGGGAKMGAALSGSLPANAPVAELPLPGLASNPQSLALSEKKLGRVSADSVKDKAQKESSALLAPAIYFARSQSWMYEETQSSLSYGENTYRQLEFGNNRLQGAENQQPSNSTEGLLMAAIKPEAANSPEFFPNIVASNQLITVEPQPELRQLSPANSLPPNSQAVDGKLDATNTAPLTALSNTSATNLFQSQRFQMPLPHSPQGNSFVLFVNRDEADRILNQLQEAGLVASKIWKVGQPSETDAGSINGRNIPSAGEPRNTDDARNAGRSMNANAESSDNKATDNKVIVLLNGQPY